MLKFIQKNKEKKEPQYKMPPTLSLRYRNMIMISMSSAVIGIVIAAFSIPNPGWYGPPLIFVILGLAMFAIANAFKRKVIYQGFDEYEGTLIFIKTKYLSLRRDDKDAIAYHVKTDDGKVYQIPTYKSSVSVPVGERLTFIVPKDVTKYERDGLTMFSTVWGYFLSAESSGPDQEINETE